MEYGELFHEQKRPYFHEPQASENTAWEWKYSLRVKIQLESEITSPNTIANLVPYPIFHGRWPISMRFHFFTICSEKSGIAFWLVRAEYANCCHGIIEWQELDLECFLFSPILYNVLHMTSRTTERRCSRKRISHYSAGKWVSLRPMHKKSQPTAVVTRQEQQEATTHCGSEFEN